ncbi:DUF4390 domain-containing protein [Caenimonas terrae]|uniref:DUF4390 domain-containing protein n=1 Tax=Caenimonas terrae TaxID=696074 RepID=A0ABW0N6J9_9BURK
MKKTPPHLGKLRKQLERTARLLAACVFLALAWPALAQGQGAEITQAQLERTEEGLFLSAAVRFDLPAVIEDALLKGIPMFFVAEAVLYRDRWYWYDRELSHVQRHMRLSYQPLTRRWRLTIAPTVIGNSGVALGQSFDSEEEALAAVQRVSRWKIADAADISPHERYNVDFRFRLDVSQLPRPFQIGAVGQADWNISVFRNQRVPADITR